MSHIFISYSKADTRQLALDIRAALQQLPGITAWMDDSLYSGEDWAIQIQEEIDRCDYMVVLISPDVNRPATKNQARSFVLREIHYAQQNQKPIIPVMAQTAKVPVQIAGIQYIDFTRDQTIGIQKLLQDIAKRTGVPIPKPTPPPIAPPSPQPTRSASRSLISSRYALIGIGLLVFAVLIIAVISSLNNPPATSETPAPTAAPTQIAAPPTGAPTFDPQAAAQATHDANLTRIAESWTPTPSPTPTITPTPTPTIDIQATIDAAGTVLANQDLTAAAVALSTVAYMGVTHNADWTPHTQTIDGVDMVLVPAGCFEMGSDPDAYYWDDRKNQYVQNVPDGGRQCFDQPFWIDRTEVTNAQFAQFKGVAANQSNWTASNRPRESITWFESRGYCALRGGRLPTEAEWEYAARGPDSLKYPWGNDFNPDYVVNGSIQTADVGSKPDGVSWVGALDMSGNVWEWVSTIYQPYPYSATDGREQNSSSASVLRGLRGGSFSGSSGFLRAASRSGGVPLVEFSNVGLRCVAAPVS